MPANSRPEELLDRRLVKAAWLIGIAGIPFAAAAGAIADGRLGAIGAVWGIAFVGLNAVAAAWISAQGAKTERGISIARVVIALPIRLALLAAACYVGIGLLDLPDKPVGFAVIAGELTLMTVQSLLVLRSPTFIGPLDLVASSLEKGATE